MRRFDPRWNRSCSNLLRCHQWRPCLGTGYPFTICDATGACAIANREARVQSIKLQSCGLCLGKAHVFAKHGLSIRSYSSPALANSADERDETTTNQEAHDGGACNSPSNQVAGVPEKSVSKTRFWMSKKQLASTKPTNLSVNAIISSFGLSGVSIGNFLRSKSEVLLMEDCPTFKLLAPEMASALNLDQAYSSDPSVKSLPSMRDMQHSSRKPFICLVKTAQTPNDPDFATTQLNQVWKKLSLEDKTGALLEDMGTSHNGVLRDAFPIDHWRFLLCSTRGFAAAMPTLAITWEDSEPKPETLKNDLEQKPSLISMTNRHFGLTATTPFRSRDDFYRAFKACLFQYCKLAFDAVPHDLEGLVRFDPDGSPPLDFVAKAVSLLGLGGDVRFTHQTLYSIVGNSGEQSEHVSRFQLQISKGHDFGSPVLWVQPKVGRLLAAASVCEDLKRKLLEATEKGVLDPGDYYSCAQCWGDFSSSPSPQAKAENLAQQKYPKTALQPLPKAANNEVQIDGAVIDRMLSTLRELRGHEFDSTGSWPAAGEAFQRPVSTVGHTRHWSNATRRVALRRMQQASTILRSEKDSLPVRQPDISARILSAVRASDITIITSATGSGKSTQIPQLLFDEHIFDNRGSTCNILCTQPRRVSAVAVARRVAAERGQTIGEEVGCSLRFDSQPPSTPEGITYMTSGYFIRLLESDPARILSRYSYIMLDEVHNRELDTDLILTAVKNLLKHPQSRNVPRPKIILMSATIDPAFFSNYFSNDDPSLKVSTIDVPGRTYGISERRLDDLVQELGNAHSSRFNVLKNEAKLEGYLKDQNCGALIEQQATPDEQVSIPAAASDELSLPSDMVPVVQGRLIELLVRHILSTTESGDILIFLPGLGELDAFERIFNEGVPFPSQGSAPLIQLFKLHSALYDTNYDVFKAVPRGVRRIIVATNIAETSLTLADVKYVIDSGLSRHSTYNQATQSGYFGLRWISKAEVAQRKGRTGRTQPGNYYAMYSDHQYGSMADVPEPELSTTDLEQVVLRTQSSDLYKLRPSLNDPEQQYSRQNPGDVLKLAPTPPSQVNVDVAAQQLRYLHSLTTEGEVTPMGKVQVMLPTVPTASKIMLLGLLFRCCSPLLVFANMPEALMLIESVTEPQRAQQARLRFAGESDDDNVAYAKAFFMFNIANARRDHKQTDSLRTEHCIKPSVFKEIAQACQQCFDILKSLIGIDTGPSPQPMRSMALFPVPPRYLDENSGNVDLLKALAFSTAGRRLAIWQSKSWKGPDHGTILPIPRSVNFSGHGARKNVIHQRLRREQGDIMTYNLLRVIPKDKHPWASTTSIVSPLIGMLFGEKLKHVGNSELKLNDWATYKIKAVNSDIEAEPAAKIILEYRKALDRFLAEAFHMIALRPEMLTKVWIGEMRGDEFNKYFRDENNPIQKLMVDSVIDILRIDGEKRKARAELRQKEAEKMRQAVEQAAEEEKAKTAEAERIKAETAEKTKEIAAEILNKAASAA